MQLYRTLFLLLGFLAFAGILFTLSPLLIVFLCVTTGISFLLNRRISRWIEKNREEKAGYEHRMQYVVSAAEDVRAAARPKGAA